MHKMTVTFNCGKEHKKRVPLRATSVSKNQRKPKKVIFLDAAERSLFSLSINTKPDSAILTDAGH